MDYEKHCICVLDASTYVGFWILKGLLSRGYTVHAAIQRNGLESEIEKEITELKKVHEERLSIFTIDVLDYHSIHLALKGCTGLFCCLDSSDGYDEKIVDWEVRGAINVVEACAQTESIEKVVFTSSLTAAIWRENISSEIDIDERSWTKTLSEQAAWALAMDRMVNMVSINSGLVLGPCVTQQNPLSTTSYLNGAAQMYENGVLAFVDVDFLVDVHIRALEDSSTCGRYFCFNQIVNTEQEAVKLAEKYACEGSEVFTERLRTKKLNKLVESTACY
ncbi:hypothetical protein G4B88_005085 [Cannabis sativa]|uniref:NAD(P)-binding domain-containing protein n=1 Tax=Cannabis sativa TaxID=3483 RepID=A0A7J6H4K9_CANSA|nr:hypothetical protein G4B88_005085 [Cannabis sativa]